MPLDADVVRLAKGPNLATVVTLMPDGQPQALLTWIDTDGENLLVNTEPSRQRSKNIARDPRVTVLIHSADNPFDWAEVRGTATGSIDGDQARGTSTSFPVATWAPTTRPRSARTAGSCS